MEDVTKSLEAHYRKKFLEFGPTAKGVDWGSEKDVLLRHRMMYDVVLNDHFRADQAVFSLLDVGCGYGAFFEFLKASKAPIDYSGIDVVDEMIDYAKRIHPDGNFSRTDFLKDDTVEEHDYVICNGILTQKLTAGIMEMDQFANALISKMYKKARRGIAFNIMSSKVNFMVENLYYRHPIDTFAFCLSQLSSKVRIEHSYPLYEYTVYVYRSDI